MAKKTEIVGLTNVISNLNKEIQAIEGRTMAGLIEAQIIVRYDMDKTPPLIPVDTNNLRASWSVSTFYVKGNPALLMGFFANYAVFVHELIDKTSKLVEWKRPGSGPKFFEASLKRNYKNILMAIYRNAKIKK